MGKNKQKDIQYGEYVHYSTSLCRLVALNTFIHQLSHVFLVCIVYSPEEKWELVGLDLLYI